MKVWSWRQAVQKADIPSTTKLVLFNLSVYMNEAGDSCFPSTKKQAEDTGLSERSVCTHLEKAEKAGFIEKKKHGSGQGWSRHSYIPSIPQGTELGSAREGGKALNLVPKGTEPDDKKALKEVQSNTPYNTPYNSPLKKYKKKIFDFEGRSVSSDQLAEVFWRLYPNVSPKGAPGAAKDLFKKLIETKGVKPHDIIEGTKRYAHYCQATDTYNKHATTFLNAKKRAWSEPWEVETLQRQGDISAGFDQAFSEIERGFSNGGSVSASHSGNSHDGAEAGYSNCIEGTAREIHSSDERASEDTDFEFA